MLDLSALIKRLPAPRALAAIAPADLGERFATGAVDDWMRLSPIRSRFRTPAPPAHAAAVHRRAKGQSTGAGRLLRGLKKQPCARPNSVALLLFCW